MFKNLIIYRTCSLIFTLDQLEAAHEPEAVRGIAGITIVTGVEDFIVTPFEAKAEVAV